MVERWDTTQVRRHHELDQADEAGHLCRAVRSNVGGLGKPVHLPRSLGLKDVNIGVFVPAIL